ncbi:MAG: hypothetical protein KGL53_02615, partial [Elusimicrobia bacterium]|nr:hypothetical protein [Elusimicrobiota bacterium]
LGGVAGTILHAGSAAGSIRVEVGKRSCADCGDIDVQAFQVLSGTGTFALGLLPPATDYVVQAYVDSNGNNQHDGLEAFASSSPVTVQANSTNTVNLIVRDAGSGSAGTSVIFGTVTYSGASTGTVFVGFATDQNFSFIPYVLTQTSTGYFIKQGVQGGTTYYIGAFIDANGNGNIDDHGAYVEPTGNYNGQLYVPASSSVGVAFAIQDPSNGVITGTVTYNGSVSGPVIVEANPYSPSGGGGGNSQSITVSTYAKGAFSYTLPYLDGRPYQLFAFVDANNDGRPEYGEPSFFRQSPVAVSSGTGSAPTTGVNLVIFDAGAAGGSGNIGQVSGSLTYNGTQPGPIVVQAFTTSTFVGSPAATVNASGTSGGVNYGMNGLATGATYFFRAFKDGNNDGVPETQYEAYAAVSGGVYVSNDQPVASAAPATLQDPGSTGPTGSDAVSLTFQYQGALSSGPIYMALFKAPDPANPDASTLVRLASAAFTRSTIPMTFSGLAAGRYWAAAFLDGNGNQQPDAGDPYGFGSSAGYVTGSGASPVVSICDRQGLNMGVGAVNAFSMTTSDCRSAEPARNGAFQRLLTFLGNRGQLLDATMDAASDDYLYLFDDRNQLVAQDDQSGGNGDARIRATLPRSSTYTLVATFFSPGVAVPFKVILQNSGGAVGSIAGSINYSGSQGGNVVAGLFNSVSFDSSSFVAGATLNGPSAFSFANLPTPTSYYLGAFVDVNGNNQPDNGEDFGVFSTTGGSTASPIYLLPGQNVSGLLLTIQASSAAITNPGHVTGVISYSTPTTAALRVEFWADAGFSGRPLAVRSIPTGPGPYDLIVSGGQPYIVRAFLDLNGDFIPNPNEPQAVYAPEGDGAEQVNVPANGSIDHVDLTLLDPGFKAGQANAAGEGTVTLSPSSFTAGVSQVLESSVTVGPSGIAAGGDVAFGVPQGWPAPQETDPTAPGYTLVWATLQGGAPATVSTEPAPGGSAGIVADVEGTPLTPGSTVFFRYTAAAPCQTGASQFFYGSASSQTVAAAQLYGGLPTVTVAAGAAVNVSPADSSVGLQVGTTSQSLLLYAYDACGNNVAVAGSTSVYVAGVRFSTTTSLLETVPSSVLSVSTGSAAPFVGTATVAFSAGQSSATYVLLAGAAGQLRLRVTSKLNSYATVNAVTNNTITGVTVSTTPTAAVAQTSATIVPTGDTSFPNRAYINFRIGDPTQSWYVFVTSNPWRADTPSSQYIAAFSGRGQPAAGSISWGGLDASSARVPQGVYFVHILVNGATDDSLLLYVQGAQLAMTVLDRGVTPNLPIGNVTIYYYGPYANGLTFTDLSGADLLAGLAPGNYRLVLMKDGYEQGDLQVALTSGSAVTSVNTFQSNIVVSTSAAGGLQVLMVRAPTLAVVPSISTAAAPSVELWGSIQVQNSTNGFVTNGPLHLPAGSTTFDTGVQWDSSVSTYVAKKLVNFGLTSNTYTVTATLPGFDAVSTDVFVPSYGRTTLNLPPFTRRGLFVGTVTLPSGFNTAGALVSLNAVPLTTTTVLGQGFGSLSLAAGVASGSYRVEGLKAGLYRLSASVPGLQSLSTAAVIVNGQPTAEDFTFQAATQSVLVASVTVSWNSGTTFPALNGSAAGLRVNVTAWAPNDPNSAYRTVDVSTTSASLSTTVVVSVTGLSVNTTYQVFVGLDQNSSADFSTLETLPASGFIPAAVGVATVPVHFVAASGQVNGTIYLPNGKTDFTNVTLFGKTVASVHPDQVGKTFQFVAGTLPGFSSTGSTGTFTVTGVNTETDDITFSYATTGRTFRKTISIVNGATTTVVAD